MSLAYRDLPAEALLRDITSEQRRSLLFDVYIDRMLERKTIEYQYSNEVMLKYRNSRY